MTGVPAFEGPTVSAEERAPADPARPRGALAGLTTRRLAVAVLFVGLFATAVSIHVDADTFWHLSSGAWMLEHGRVLDFDAFSHTAAGRPWINASWLSDVVMAGVHRLAGYAGLNLLASLAIWATLVVLFFSGRADTYVRALVVALAAAAMAVFWSARPEIVSLFMAAVFNLILIHHRREGGNGLWLLPPLTVLWANLDGGFVIGLLLAAVTFCGELLAAVVDRLRPVPPERAPRSFALPVRLGGAGLACLLATAANPYGFAILPASFRTLSMGLLPESSWVLHSPDFQLRATQFFIVLWLAAFAVVGVSRRRLEITDFLLFSVFSAGALMAAGNIAVFAVVAAPILMWHGGALVSEFEAYALRHGLVRPRPRATLVLNWALLCLVVIAAAIKVQWPLSRGATELSMARTLPVGAVTYLRTHTPEGALFNSYRFGGFLAWHLHPRHAVFLDGRKNLYDAAIMSDYVLTYGAGLGFEAALERRGVGVVLVDLDAPIARALLADPGWALVYRDWLSVVLVRRGA